MRKGRRIQEIKGERVKKTQKHSRKLGSGRERKDLCFLAIFIAGTFFFYYFKKKNSPFYIYFFSSICLAPEGRGNKVSLIQFIFFYYFVFCLWYFSLLFSFLVCFVISPIVCLSFCGIFPRLCFSLPPFITNFVKTPATCVKRKTFV